MGARVRGATGEIRWAVVGCGWVARDYGIPGILSADGGRLIACVDRDPGALQRTAAKIGDDEGRVRYIDRFDASDLSDVDAVYIATPNAAHHAAVESAAAAGKHVLCEKPISSRPGEAPEMLAACQAARVGLAVAFDQRHHPAHRMIADMIGEGDLGTITLIRIHYACWLPNDWSPDGSNHDNWRIDAERSGGGAAIDLAPHGVDLVEFLTDQPVSDIHAMFQSAVHRYDRRDMPIDDGAVLTLRTEGGVLASLAVSYACPDHFPRRRLEVVGTDGMVVAENTMGQTAGGRVTLHRPTGTAHDVAFDVEAGPFHRQIEWFNRSVRTASCRDAMDVMVARQVRTHERLLCSLDDAARHLDGRERLER